MIFTAKREMLADCLPEVKPILFDHWLELAKNKDVIALNPKFEVYQALEASGSYRGYIVRAESGEIAGYAGFMVHPHLHYWDAVWAISDLFFIKPEFRSKPRLFGRVLRSKSDKKGAGRVLFEAAEADLRASKVDVIHATFKISNPMAGKLLSRLGYSPIEKGYAKVLR